MLLRWRSLERDLFLAAVQRKGDDGRPLFLRMKTTYFFFAPLAFALLLAFLAILPPWRVAAQLSVRCRAIPTGGVSDPPSYKM